MKKLLILALCLPLVVSAQWWNPFNQEEAKLGASIQSFFKNVNPELDSTYWLGTTTPATKAWRGLIVDEICITGDTCRTAWPTGGGGSGGGTWSTTTSQVAGRLINYPNNNTDIVAIGSNATTSAEYWFDPNTLISFLSGKVGIGTTSPYAPLSVVGEVVASHFTGTTTATSSLAGQLLVNRLQVSTTTATSTFTGGVQINRLQTLASSTLAGLVIDAGGLKISTLNCSASNELLQTDASGSVICGTDDSAGGSASSTLLSDNNTFTGNNIFSSITRSTTTQATTSNLAISSLSSALVRVDANGSTLEYAGTSCTNQFVRSLDAVGAATCATVANTDLANSTISGISLGSNLANLSATDSTLTFSGTYNGGTARTIGVNLTNGNVWTPASTTFVNGVTIGNATTTNATSTTSRTGTLGVGSEYFTDLTGTGLALTGGALNVTNVPNALTAGTGLTSAGTYNGATARTFSLDTASANNWTALQTFTNASTSLLSVTSRAYFGGMATTTIDSVGNIVIPSGSNLTITGKSDGCATFASGVLNSTGSACGSGGGGGASTTLLADNNSWSGENRFISTTATTSVANTFSVGSTTPSGDSMFSVGTSSPLFHVDKTSGFVGVGTTDPTAPLSVYNSTGGNDFVIQNSSGVVQFAINSGGITMLNGSPVNISSNAGYWYRPGVDLPIGNSADNNDGSVTITAGLSGTNGSTNLGFNVSGNEVGRFIQSGNFGIGTTSPYAKLSVVGEIVGSHFTGTTTATSSFAGALLVDRLQIASTTATSTAANGINLSAGCFSINNVCVGGGGSSASSTLLGDNNSWTGANIFNSITRSTTTDATSTTLAVTGSGTSTRITNNINIGGNLNVGGSATNTFANGISLTSGCFSVNNVCIGASGSSASSTLLSDNNTWSGLNNFGRASTTQFSSLGPITVGTTSTTTLYGNSTSTFTGGINLTNGGCFAINGNCVSGSGSGTSSWLAVKMGQATSSSGTGKIATTVPMVAGQRIKATLDISVNCQQQQYIHFAIKPAGSATTTIGKNYDDSNCAVSSFRPRSISGEYVSNSTENVQLYAALIDLSDASTTADVFSAGTSSISYVIYEYGQAAGGGGGGASTTLLADNNTWSGTNRLNATTTASGGLVVGTTSNLILANGTLLGVDQSNTGAGIGNMISDSNTLSNLFVIAAHGTGAQAGVNAFTSAGSSESPTASPANADFYFMGGRGYSGTGYASSSSAVIRFRSANTQSNTNAGSYMSFETTPLNSLTRSSAMSITETQNLLIGSTTWAFGIPSRLDVTSRPSDTVPILSLRHGTGSATTSVLTVDRYGRTGVGTSTGLYAQLTASSSTAPQLALTDGSLTSVQHIFRSMGNTFDFSTSSPSTNATSSVPIFSVDANGFLKFGNPRSIATTTAVRLQGCSPSTQSARFAPGGAYWGPLDMTNDFVDQWAWYMVNATSSSITCKVQIPQNLAPVPNPRLISVYSATTTTVANYALDIDIAQYDPMNGLLDVGASSLTNILAGSTTASQRLVNRNTAFQTVGTSTSIGSTLTAGNTLLVRFTYWGADADDTSNTDLLFLDEESKLLVDLMAQ